MNTYLIPPNDCLLILAFKRNATIRDAAQALGCDAGGLLRKVHRIAREHGVLEKTGGHWQLTPKGTTLISWVEETIQSQQRLLQSSSTVRIATTMWLSEQIIIPSLGKLKRELKQESNFLITTPVKSLENEMILGQTDFVIACHPPHDPLIAHKKIIKEEYRVIVPGSWNKDIKNKSESSILEFLASRPYIRHNYLNPDVFLDYFINRKIDHEITVDHLIGVRSAVINGLGWSCVPALLVKEESQSNLRLIKLKNEIPSESHLCLWWRRDNRDSKRIVETMAQWLKSSV